MRFPWTSSATRREREAVKRAEEAKRLLAQVEQQWPKARAVAGETRTHRELNGWTDTVKTIFGGNT